MLHSYDIFDTLITRNTATPDGIFCIIQKKIQTSTECLSLPSDVRDNFYSIRKNAEYYLKRHLDTIDSEEITLDEIYTTIAKNNGLTYEEVSLLKKYEIECEFENIVGINQNIIELKQKIASGEKVILISDMYLPEVIVRKMLISVDPVFINVPIYISSELKLSKNSGNLYRYIHNHEKCKYNEWIHVGDNPFSDVLCPNKLGISAKIYSSVKFLSYESEILKKYPNNLSVQISLGISRVMRINHTAISDLGLIGLSIAGPLLYSYVSWVLEQSDRLNIHELYFIARDGFVLKKIADQILSVTHKDINTHYIYGSRISWRILSINELLELENQTMFLRIKTISDIANYFNQDVSIITTYLPNQYKNVNSNLSKRDIKNIIDMLLNNPSFQCELNQLIHERKSILREYLNQEIDFEKSFGFVDLYGTGKTINYIFDLLNHPPTNGLHTFYLSGIPEKEHEYIQRYFWRYDLPLGSMIEILCRAPHGQTLRYCKKNGIIEPVLDGEIQGGSVEYDEYITMVEEYSYHMSNMMERIQFKSIDVQLFDYYYKIFSRDPNKLLVNTLSIIPYSSSTGSKATIFAPKMSLLSIFLDYYHNGNIGNTTGSISYSLYRMSPIHQFIGKYIIMGYLNQKIIKSEISTVGFIAFIRYCIKNKNVLLM